MKVTENVKKKRKNKEKGIGMLTNVPRENKVCCYCEFASATSDKDEYLNLNNHERNCIFWQ